MWHHPKAKVLVLLSKINGISAQAAYDVINSIAKVQALFDKRHCFRTVALRCRKGWVGGMGCISATWSRDGVPRGVKERDMFGIKL